MLKTPGEALMEEEEEAWQAFLRYLKETARRVPG